MILTPRPHRDRAVSSALAIIATVTIACAMTGCTSSGTSPAHPQSSYTAPSTLGTDANSATETSPGPATPTTPAEVTNTADGPGDPLTVEPTGGIIVNAAGAVLPDPRRTPGAINSAVTQATLKRTICVSGWTATIRPPSGYTTALKKRQLASGYTYHDDTVTADYEEDHLISLELGGSPTSQLNLWPEPYNTTDGARVKDVIENKLHFLVCSGAITLAAAQKDIATDWWSAYLTYVGATTAPSAPPATPTSTRTVAQTTGPPDGATALCKDGTYSYASHHQGACSSHGGVAVFYK